MYHFLYYARLTLQIVHVEQLGISIYDSAPNSQFTLAYELEAECYEFIHIYRVFLYTAQYIQPASFLWWLDDAERVTG